MKPVKKNKVKYNQQKRSKKWEIKKQNVNGKTKIE